MYKAIKVQTAFRRGRRRARNSLSSTRSLVHRQFCAATLHAVRRVAAARSPTTRCGKSWQRSGQN
jgi:hypothetical protein